MKIKNLSLILLASLLLGACGNKDAKPAEKPKQEESQVEETKQEESKDENTNTGVKEVANDDKESSNTEKEKAPEVAMNMEDAVKIFHEQNFGDASADSFISCLPSFVVSLSSLSVAEYAIVTSETAGRSDAFVSSLFLLWAVNLKVNVSDGVVTPSAGRFNTFLIFNDFPAASAVVGFVTKTPPARLSASALAAILLFNDFI